MSAQTRRSRIGRCIRMSACVVMLAGALAAAPGVQAQARDAKSVLKAMSDYVGSQPTIELSFDSDIEVITPQLEKIQFTNSGDALLSRPNWMRAHRVGGYADVAMVFDGKVVSIFSKNLNAYAQFDAPGNVDQLFEAMRAGHGVALPVADLLLSNSYDALVAGVMEAKHIGRGVIDGARVRAPGLPQLRHRLAALGRRGRQADTAQDGDHQQDAEQRAAVHASGDRAGRRVSCRQRMPLSSPRRHRHRSSGRTSWSGSTNCHRTPTREQRNEPRHAQSLVHVLPGGRRMARLWRRRSSCLSPSRRRRARHAGQLCRCGTPFHRRRGRAWRRRHARCRRGRAGPGRRTRGRRAGRWRGCARTGRRTGESRGPCQPGRGALNDRSARSIRRP